MPASTTLANFKAGISVSTGATFEIYESNGTTVATDLADGYKIIVTAEDGTTTETYTINFVSAITNILPSDIKVYPNPASEKITIEGESISKVEVYDMLGRKVLEKSFTGQSKKNELNLNDLKGSYFLILKTNDKSYRQMMIVE